MSYYTNAAGRRLWLPEPSLEPPEERQISGYCSVCGCPLDLYDPWPLCGVCERDTREED